MFEESLKKPTSMSTVCDRKEMFFLCILSKSCKLSVTFLHSAQRTTQNQSSKPEVLAYCHEKNPDSEKQVLKQRTCHFHTALAGEGKTSDRHCLTLKLVSLPRGESALDTQIWMSPCFPLTWDCSLLKAANQQVEERPDCLKHTKDGQPLLCSTPGGSWLLHMTLVKEKLWMLYYYVFLLFLIVFKQEAYFWDQAHLLLPHLHSLTKFLPQTWEKQGSHTQWNIEVIWYCELLPFGQYIFSVST